MKFTTLLTMIFISSILTACGGGGDDTSETDESDNMSTGTNYVVSGKLSDLQGSGTVDIRLHLYFSRDVSTTGDDEFISREIVTTGNGNFTFSMTAPDGASYYVSVIDQPDNPLQRCDGESGTIENGNIESGTITGSDVSVSIICENAYTVSGTLTGLASGKSVHLSHTVDGYGVGEPVGSNSSQTLHANGNFVIEYPHKAGEEYNIGILQGFPPNSATEQRCDISINGAANPSLYFITGIIDTTNVTNIEVDCDSYTLSGTVTGLLGDGITLALDVDEVFGGATPVLGKELLSLDQNGAFKFEFQFKPGDFYRVRVILQPSTPDQTCMVENESGLITAAVTDIVVRCPNPKRTYLYHDHESYKTRSETSPHGTPLRIGEQTGGVLDDVYSYPKTIPVPLGFISGLNVNELFQLHFNDSKPTGAVHSSETGESYWLAVESNTFLHQVELHTTWRLRKVAEDTTFKLQISAVNMLGFID